MKRLRPLQLDFAADPPRSSWGVVLLGAGLVACAGVGVDYMAASEQVAELAQRQATLERRLERQSALSADGTTPDPQLSAEAARQLQHPWDALLGDLEKAIGETGGSVALLSVQPDVAQRQVRLTGEARQLAEILAFVGRLEGQPSLRHPALTSHQSRQSEDVPVIAFTIVAGWQDSR